MAVGILQTSVVITSCPARLFRKKGYKATARRDLAEAVGIKAASIYNHIASKQALLEDLLLKMTHLFSKGMEAISKSAALSSEQKLECLIGLPIRLTVENTAAIALISGEWVHLESPAREGIN